MMSILYTAILIAIKSEDVMFFLTTLSLNAFLY